MSNVVWEEASDNLAREEVYRFRYEQYFAAKECLPGTQHSARRVWLPHDEHSKHFVARMASGDIAAVGSATPAVETLLYDEWQKIFALPRLHALLPHLVLISRVIVAREVRSSSLFGQLCLYLARVFLEDGYHYAAHYCSPGMVSLYERLGYRLYGHGQNLDGGPFRLPMLLVVDDAPYLKRVHSPFRILNRQAELYRPWVTKAMNVCPELEELPPCSLPDDVWHQRILSLCPQLTPLPYSRIRLLKRGSIIQASRGDVLAPEHMNEGNFLVLSGCLRQKNTLLEEGTTVYTGSAAVCAEKDSLVLSIPSEKMR